MQAAPDRNRNYKCRLREMEYCGVRHIFMENEVLRIGVAAGKGADITEFLYKPKDLDFMWHSFNPLQNPITYAPSKQSGNGTFLDLYEGGWQELFPNYGGPVNYKGAEYGLHGEVCVVPWQYSVELDTPEEISINLWVRTPSTPYLLERRMTLKSGVPCLYIKEKITNESPVPMEYMWGHHPVLGAPFLDESCEIILPQSSKSYSAHTLANAGVLPANQTQAWPHFTDTEGNRHNLAHIQPAQAQKYREYGISGLAQGECSVWNANQNIGFALQWDEKQFPYLWIWEPNGGNLNHPWYGRNYVLGVEPWSHLAGSLQEVLSAGQAMVLEPWQTKETWLNAAVKLER
ncbi:MAG: DUF4432 family protein [Oscillospiraceae bacterium]